MVLWFRVLLTVVFLAGNSVYATFGAFNPDTDEGFLFLKDRGASLLSIGRDNPRADDTLPEHLLLKYGPSSRVGNNVLVVKILADHPDTLGNLGFCVYLFQHFPTSVVWNTGALKGLLYQKFGTRSIYRNLVGLSIGPEVPTTNFFDSLNALLHYDPHKRNLKFLKVGPVLDDEDFNRIGGAIKGLEFLSVLDLSGQKNLGPHGIKILGEILGDSPHLRALILHNINLREQTAFPTQWPRNLTHVDLQGSDIPPPALKPLLESPLIFRFSERWVDAAFDRGFALNILNASLNHTGKELPSLVFVADQFEKLVDTYGKIPLLGRLVRLRIQGLDLAGIASMQTLLAQKANMDLQSDVLMGETSSGAKAAWTAFHDEALRQGYTQSSGRFEVKNTGGREVNREDPSDIRHWAADRLIEYGHEGGATVSLKIKEKVGHFSSYYSYEQMMSYPNYPELRKPYCGYNVVRNTHASFESIDVLPYLSPKLHGAMTLWGVTPREFKSIGYSPPYREPPNDEERISRMMDVFQLSYAPHTIDHPRKDHSEKYTAVEVDLKEFSFSYLCEAVCNKRSFKRLCEFLKSQTELERLSIPGPSQALRTDVFAKEENMRRFVDVFDHLKKLQTLGFRRHDLSDSTMALLYRALPKLSALHQIGLDYCPLTCAGAKALGKAVGPLHLTHLYARQMRAKKDAVMALAQGFYRNLKTSQPCGCELGSLGICPYTAKYILPEYFKGYIWYGTRSTLNYTTRNWDKTQTQNPIFTFTHWDGK